jgi:cytochrome c oxidase subunit III
MSNHENHTHVHRDDEAQKLGMWLFIFTELLLFGGLFLVYSIFRSQYPENFHESSLELSVTFGVINTVVLLVSSMSVAISLTAVQKGNSKLAMQMLLLTVFLAAVFMVNKYFEWSGKFHHGLYPGSDLMQLLDRGHHLYFGLYFFMTGLHALHIIIGVILLLISYVKIQKGKIQADNFMHLENAALYWHLVDLIWIFLFPLLYLIS